MQGVVYPPKGTYIVAVSGGVDSVVLLDLLAKQQGSTYIVAHFDHGIRPTSANDAAFVEQLARRYDLQYVSERQELGESASEYTARRARYDFLQRVRLDACADAIVTAHHRDDVVETIIINILRGTGWRGLCSLRSTAEVIRPLLAVSKQNIVSYAKDSKLQWQEDETNHTDTYLRNRVRAMLVGKEQHIEALWELYLAQERLADEIDIETEKLSTTRRYPFIMWPENVAMEVLRCQLVLTRPQARAVLHAIKTAKPGAIHEAGVGQLLRFTCDQYVLETHSVVK